MSVSFLCWHLTGAANNERRSVSTFDFKTAYRAAYQAAYPATVFVTRRLLTDREIIPIVVESTRITCSRWATDSLACGLTSSRWHARLLLVPINCIVLYCIVLRGCCCKIDVISTQLFRTCRTPRGKQVRAVCCRLCVRGFRALFWYPPDSIVCMLYCTRTAINFY